MIKRTLSQEIKEIGIKSHKYLKFVTLDSAEELDKFILKSKLIGMVVRDFRYRDTKGTSGMVIGDEMQCYIVENDTNIYFVYNKRFRLTETSSLFSNTKYRGIDISQVDISNAFSMFLTFNNIRADQINLSGIDTSKVTTMSNMFSNCSYGKNLIIDLKSLDTSKVTNMGSMFGNSTLKEIRLDNINTSKVETMNSMFYRTKTKEINLSTLDLHNVSTMIQMFNKTEAEKIDLSNWTVKCKSRQYIDVESMFRECKAKVLNINNLDLSKLKNIDNMFDDCEIEKILFQGKEYTTKEMQEIIKNYDGHRDYKRHNK